MKEIKAFVRSEVAKALIKKLEEYGIKNIMVNKVNEIADWDDKDAEIYSLRYLEKYNLMIRIDFFCQDNEKEIICELIRSNSKTGHKDEGVIIIQHAEKFIPISKKNNEQL